MIIMKRETREKIKNFIIDFASEITKVPFTIEELKKAFPFHTIFFPEEALISFKQQRSIVTKMGMTLYPKIAEIVAKDQYHEVHLDHEIVAEIDVAKVNVIDRIINDLRAGRIEPNFNKENQRILTVAGGGKRKIRIIADLFVGDFKPGPLFMEIKSPRPNLDVCAESKKKMLFFRAVFVNKEPEAFLAFPYNPFIYRENYRHGFTKRIMDMRKEVLIGEEMWNKLGGAGTYNELLNIIEEAKKEIKRTHVASLDEF
jgi:hypothetical protein